MKEFQTAKMDDRTKMFTLILVAFLVFFPISSFFFQPPKPLISLFSSILLWSVIVISYAFVPKRISITDSQMMIKNLYGRVFINLIDIYSLSKVESKNFNLRTFGVGGLFGYFGYFNGNDVWYVTNINKKIKLTLKSGKVYMLSPENTDEFIFEIQKRKS